MPQGSVLGPLLWNITFDNILKEEVPPVVSVICYTDDTLVVTVLLRGPPPLWWEIDMCARILFCKKFNSEQLLSEALLDVMRIIGSVEP